MKNSRIVLLACCLLLSMSACKKDDNPANPGGGGNVSGEGSFTINGAGLNNATFVIPSNPLQGLPNIFARGIFDPQSVTTSVGALGFRGGDSLLATVVIGFRGNQAGNFQGNSSTPRIIIVAVNDRLFVAGFESVEPGSAIYPNTTFNLNVTRYDAVGGRIQGNYTGTLREVTGEKGNLGNTSITITGNFNVQRLPDGTDDGGDDRTIKPFSFKAVQVE